MFVMRSCIISLKAKINVSTKDSLMQMPFTDDPIIHRWYHQNKLKNRYLILTLMRINPYKIL